MQLRTFRFTKYCRIGVLFLFSLSLAACSTYQSKVSAPRELLHQGKFEEAINQLKPLAEKKSDDQLLFLMELGSAYQMAGRYRESNQVFLKADKLSEQVDYHSVTNVSLAALGSEEMIQYKGESYEKLLINASMALNYTMLGQLDEALVEARRINEKVNKIRQEGRANYEQNPFAHYLSGFLWEADGKFDDAYISFNDSYQLDPMNPYLPGDLIRLAKKSRRDDAYKKWKKEFPEVNENPDWYDKNKGEIIVIIEQGWGPKKGFAPENRRLPRLYPSYSQTKSVRAELESAVGSKSAMNLNQNSQMVYNVEQVAIKTLDADYGWMVARKIGAFAAKEIVADQLRQKNELLGLVAWVGMHASDRADLRQWSLLPQSIQLARFWVPAGDYKLSLQGLDGSSGLTNDRLEKVPLKVKPGTKTFYFWRPLR